MWQKLILAIVISVATIGGGEVRAAIVIFQFQGEVIEVPSALAPEFNVGEEISGTMRLTSTQPQTLTETSCFPSFPSRALLAITISK